LPEKPSTSAALYFAPEATRLIGILRDAGLTDAQDWLDMHKVASHRIPLSRNFENLQMAVAQGIGFGSRYPELTSQLLTDEIDAEKYHRLRAAGLDVPAAPPAAKTMQQRQEQVLSMIRPYIEQAWPDLVAALGLTAGAGATRSQEAPPTRNREADPVEELRVRLANVIPDHASRDRVIENYRNRFPNESVQDTLQGILDEYAR
jgi:hypothetical protein